MSIADLVMPSTYTNVGKTLNSANVFMDLVINYLKDIQNCSISASSLLNNSGSLVGLVEAYMRLAKKLGFCLAEQRVEAGLLVYSSAH